MNRTTKTRAFTLAELLIVIAIIAILVTIGVVAGGKAYRWANVKETRANMAIIMNAIMAYQENMGFYPPLASPNSGYFEVSGKSTAANDTLAFNLVANEFAQKRLKDLPDDAFSSGFTTATNGEVTGGFVDAWGKPFLYSYDAGLGGTPVLVSAGPDGYVDNGSSAYKIDFDTPALDSDILDPTIKRNDKFYNKDNISSDSE